MKFTRFFVSGAISISLAATAASAQSVGAQTAAPTQAEQEAARAARAELEAKAFKLLEEAAAEAESLRLPENRARLQAAAAAALWPHDQERARAIFQSALAGVSSIASSISAEEPRYEQHYHRVQNLRREIAFAVAQREPRLALDFVRGTRVAPPPRAGDPNYHQPDQELALEMQMAELVAARDPREAIRLAEESLSRGVSGHLPNLIERVRSNDAQAASKLAADTVRKLRTSNLSANYEAANVAAYLLHATRPPAAATQAGTNGVAVLPAGGDARSLTLDEAARRDLVALVVNAALAGGAERRPRGRDGGQLLSSLQAVLPEVERLMPAQAPALRRRLAGVEGGADQPAPRDRRQEFEQLMQTGTADAILQAAGRAPAEMRWQLYRRAASKALEEGSPERARQIINDSVTNPQQREQLLREIDSQLFWRAAGQGDAQQALALLARFKSPEERTQMMLSLAQSAAARGNRELAERLLEEILGQAGGRARNMGQFSVQLQAGHAYAGFAPERSFQIAESSVERLNELMGVAEQVDGFGQEAFDQGELKLEGSVWSGLVQQAGALLAALAPKDFERAREVAARFQRGEARAHAMLAVARGTLGDGGDLPIVGRRRVRPTMIGPAVRRP
jgi:hypothetical protein